MNIDAIVIDSILFEHTAIKHSIGVLRDAMAEQATFLLHYAGTWNRTHLQELKDNHLKLRDSLRAFRDLVIRHCSDEEKALSMVLGNLIAKGNIIEHKEIISYLNRAESLLNETKLLGNLKPQEVMATIYNVQQTVEMVCSLVDTHETNEAGMLALLKKVLNMDEKKSVPVASAENEMTGLKQEHEAIRAQMKFLADLLASLATQSIQVNDRINSYRLSLYDLRDGIRHHIELDELIFRAILDRTSIEELIREHNEIQKQVGGAIRLVDSAVADELAQEELIQRVSNIGEAVNVIRGLIEAHTDKEDRLLELLQ
jgi:hypothetical protein